MRPPMLPPFRYYGGKTQLAAHIVPLLGDHETYVEPFAGSAAVLFAKQPAKHEVINDLDGGAVTFFRVVRDRCDELVEALRFTPYAREEYLRCRDAPAVDDDIETARRWFVRTSQGFGASTDPGNGWSVSTRKNTNRARSMRHRIEMFDAIAERLAHVQIDNRPAVQVIPRHDGPHTVHYVDPPYVTSSRVSERGYAHEMTDDDHRELAEVLHSCEGRVILSGYHTPLYAELYDGWHVIEIDTVAANGARTGGRDRRVEVLWVNREPARAEQLSWELDRAA